MICFIFILSSLQFQENENYVSPSAEVVLDKFTKAKGSLSVSTRLKNKTIKGIVVSDGKTIGEFESHQAPKRHLSIDRFPDGSKRSHGTDGKIAWRIDVNGNPTVLEGQESRDYIRHYESLQESLEWRRQYRAIHDAGVKTISGEDMHHLIFVAEDNRQINRYFSIKTGLFVREEQIFELNGKTQMLISEIGDYQPDERGVLVSRSRKNHFGKDYSVQFIIQSVRTNSITDDAIFEIPAAIKTLVK